MASCPARETVSLVCDEDALLCFEADLSFHSAFLVNYSGSPQCLPNFPREVERGSAGFG